MEAAFILALTACIEYVPVIAGNHAVHVDAGRDAIGRIHTDRTAEPAIRVGAKLGAFSVAAEAVGDVVAGEVDPAADVVVAVADVLITTDLLAFIGAGIAQTFDDLTVAALSIRHTGCDSVYIAAEPVEL